MSGVTYRFADLEALIADPTISHNDGPVSSMAARLAITPGCLRQYRVRGLTAETADRLAVAAGMHPSAVWPTWDDDAFDEPVCAWCREPVFDSRYCGTVCARRMREDRKRLAGGLEKWWKRVDRYRESVDFGALDPSATNHTGVVLGDQLATQKPPHRQEPTGGVAHTHERGTNVHDLTRPVVSVAS
jgi:hypothetical protein